MGYGPSKMLSLGQKLKMPKRCEKRSYDHIRLAVCKRPLQKTLHIRKKPPFWKWLKLAKMHVLYSPCKMLSLRKKLKMPKTCEKRFYDHTRVVLCKNRSKKLLIFEKWHHFKNGQIWPRCMGYSPCKTFSLGQNLKMQRTCEKQLYDHIWVVVCKKPLQKYLTFEKWQHFKNGENWSSFLGYNPCKMLSLGQKLKMQKTVQKTIVRPHENFNLKNRSKKRLKFKKWQRSENG